MAKVLFINTGSEGHINPTIALCKALVERGEDVVYYMGDQYVDKFKDTGVEIRTIPTDKLVSAFTSFGLTHLFHVINGLLKTADVIMPQILEETKDEHYDYLIYDSMFSCGYLIAQKFNIPTVSTITSFAKTKPMFDSFANFMASQLEQDELESANLVFDTLKEHVEQTYDVKVPSRHEVMNNPGDFNISFVTQGFQLEYDAFNSTKFNFVGPSVLPPKPSGFMDNVNTNRPLIYVSLGTVFNQNVAFFNKCFSALANIDATVIVSIGKTNKAEDFDTIPNNVIIKDYVPQVEVLQHADLFLTHAGMNSTNEAIMLNVPLLAFPQSADQPVVAHQIEHLKIGQQLDANVITAEQLANTVKDMLAHRQTYQQNIEQVKNVQTHTQPGYEVGAQAILDFRDRQYQ